MTLTQFADHNSSMGQWRSQLIELKVESPVLVPSMLAASPGPGLSSPPHINQLPLKQLLFPTHVETHPGTYLTTYQSVDNTYHSQQN